MNRAYHLPLMFLFLPGAACAQKPPSPPAEADVPRIVKEIRADRIERTIETLVGFGTRNTLSAQDDPKRGIGAARDWLFGEFSALRDASGGRLVVEKQSFIQQPMARVPRPTPPHQHSRHPPRRSARRPPAIPHRQRPLQLDLLQPDRRHPRCARRERRRLRQRRGAGDGARHGPVSLPRDDCLYVRGRRGAGAAGLDLCGRAGEAA